MSSRQPNPTPTNVHSAMNSPISTHPMNEQRSMAEVNRPVTANGNMGKHRGDRRDMSPTYTNNEKHSSYAGGPRKDVKTRKR